ncbi:hypothetical protein [Mangrovibacterium diazotrophicum]|uniref:Outer membrane protein with beta-barrel domain n=1 Tax=Mangrovibacterium diazotrophicum TaxID=1261403 RepID=A0A419VX99_9BACT|nr:hypothetical protein [Mangrovibacterium diazotrophicum]RKD87710.1 hypothetical protein BC643_3717 [Mangrovibacterium diazotrophicum]
MKKQLLILMLALLAQGAFAQNNRSNDEFGTVFANDKMSNGGYGALSIAYTEIDNKDAFVVGARGGWIINHSFSLGLAGYGFINDVHYNDPFYDSFDYNLAGGYGGLFVEPIIAPMSPVHVSFPILLGFGAVSYIHEYDHWDYSWEREGLHDVFWVIEPAVELEFNMTRFFRLAATASYRLTSDVDMDLTDPDLMKGMNVGLVFKFGKF